MFRLTCIEPDNGEFAVYINHHYLGSEDASGERLSLGEVLEQLSLLPGVELQTLLEPVPECDDWCWNDIADRVLPPRPACRDDVTVPATAHRGPVAIMSLRLRARKTDVRHWLPVVPSTFQPHA